MSDALHVLVLNSGSSSLKFGLYRAVRDSVETMRVGDAANLDEVDGIIAAVGIIPDAVGHRVVHGGPSLTRHCIIDPSVLTCIETATALAPLHTAGAVAGIHHAQQRFPGVPQVACFDTAFHAGLPDVARVLPVAATLRPDGIHRYGFHGISCESVVRQLGRALPARLTIAHLGHGASVTAVRDGRSIDTSMGLTPSGGVVMGTRSGDLDPGFLLYLMRERGVAPAALEDLIDAHSGLLGVSGRSSDMRTLQQAAATDSNARLAIDIFCMSVRKQIGAMIAVLGGADMIVFTGGIGEHDEQVRRAVLDGLRWTGVTDIRVLPSQENLEIARHTRDLVSP